MYIVSQQSQNTNIMMKRFIWGLDRGCIEQVLAWLPTVAYSSADIESNISRFPPDFAHCAPALTQTPATITYLPDLKRTVLLLAKIGPFPPGFRQIYIYIYIASRANMYIEDGIRILFWFWNLHWICLWVICRVQQLLEDWETRWIVLIYSWL